MIHLVDVQELDKTNPSAVIALLSKYFSQLVDDNNLKNAFYDGWVKNFYDFRNFCLDRQSAHYVVYSEVYDAPVCHFYLNGFHGLSCMIHFSMTSMIHGHKESVPLAMDALDRIFKLRRRDEDFPLTRTLVGITPVINRPAVKFLTSVGFQKLGIIDGACYIHHKKKYIPGVLSKLESPYPLAGAGGGNGRE
jgi:hypothetical protein